MKTGRNDRCPCGSGKKYKKCCMAVENMSATQAPSIDVKWHQLRQLEEAVVYQHVFPYATDELPDDVMKSARAVCLPKSLPDELDVELLCDHYFLPWFLFDWIPFDTFGLTQFDPEMTVAQNYMKVHGNRLNTQEKRFIEIINQSYYSFYSIISVVLEKSITVKDILLGTTHTVKERQGTYQLKHGDIVFGRILTMDDQSIFIGMAPFIIPALHHTKLLDFRDWLREQNNFEALSADLLHWVFDDLVRDCFFSIIKRMFDRSMPILQNTDGESIEFSTSYFQLNGTLEDAFYHLIALSFEEDPEYFLRTAKKDTFGAIKHIQFPWIKKGNTLHKSWENTILGFITLEQGSLVLRTNSRERAEEGRALLTQYLGDAIVFKQTLIKTLEQKMKNEKDTSSKALKRNADTDVMEFV